MDSRIVPPSKPLKILTIDGGGLQAISTLLILDELLESIAKNNEVPHRKPRPCDVFDTIAGIGAGGWLAILLGRFHMDITTCLSEWYKITRNIAPRSKTEEMRLRAIKHSYFNPNRLVQQIDTLTRVYGTGDLLFDDHAGEFRTRHVFVAALRSDAEQYNLFRTYEIPKNAAIPNRLLEGPNDPANFKISSAFGVTGAARYFSPPWDERMSQSGKTRFNDRKFPNPHNITELALDEMWALYGTQVEMSVVVNIGPGLPSKHDVRQIASRFSWGLTPTTSSPVYPKRTRSPASDEGQSLHETKRTKTDPPAEATPPQPEGPSVRFLQSPDKEVSHQVETKQALSRRDTVGSIKGRTVGKKLKRKEAEIEKDIKAKLLDIYKEKGATLYHRLAPLQAPEGTARNDSLAPGVALDATRDYLKQPVTVINIDQILQQMVPAAC
ncbi:acyl transferase/acyl hydrolase/lysophospholipase [Leptodontidium sp. 2 PMI_412]|nr:acyl transferase/acyl hydrolase/lysophospholipase [Leptodontidium sp. 2 PMI_412]